MCSLIGTKTDTTSDAFIQNKPTIASADGVADSVDLALSGQTLTATIGRTMGDDLTDSVTLPAGGEGTTDYNALTNRPIPKYRYGGESADAQLEQHGRAISDE